MRALASAWPEGLSARLRDLPWGHQAPHPPAARSQALPASVSRPTVRTQASSSAAIPTRDGTSLSNCLNVYLPTPDGRWRMIVEVLRDTTTGEVVLSYLAFGVAHPEHPWQPSVYQIGHQRLHHPADQPEA